MQIIIDIPDELYDTFKRGIWSSTYDGKKIRDIVLNGKPLQKGHEKLVDVEDVKERLSEIPWIDIREELPEDGTWNLFTDGNRISIERYKFDAMDHFWPSGRWFDLEDAIAWMPLPITVWRERAEELIKEATNDCR